MNFVDIAHYLMMCRTECFRQVCQSTGLNQTQLEILIFLKCSPEHTTAGDIEKAHRIKANLLSVNVDRLVKDGYLTREKDPADRRRINLHLTEKSLELAENCSGMQRDFFSRLTEGLSAEEMDVLQNSMAVIEKNMKNFISGCKE